MQVSSSEITSEEQTLRHDINTLLSYFNEMEIDDTSLIHKKAARKILDVIQVQHKPEHLKQEVYTFDDLLSIIGTIEIPTQPSLYVLSFIKILTLYKKKCLEGEQLGWKEADQVQRQITLICNNELDRLKDKLQRSHNKIFEEMQISQERQLLSFESEWQKYLQQFEQETERKLKETKYIRRQTLLKQEKKMVDTYRRTSIVTSPKLCELYEKKKCYVKEKKYSNAIDINSMIRQEQYKIFSHKQDHLDILVRKKRHQLSQKNQKVMDYLQSSLKLNRDRLLIKKKEGQNIMRIRMKSLREEAHRKLNDHLRNQVNRLKSSFQIAIHS